jgi:hypothetical protein
MASGEGARAGAGGTSARSIIAVRVLRAGVGCGCSRGPTRATCGAQHATRNLHYAACEVQHANEGMQNAACEAQRAAWPRNR